SDVCSSDLIEALGGAGYCFGRQFAGQPGQCNSVTGKALQVKHIVRQASEVRRAAHGDVQVAAPGIVNLDLFERREHARHALGDGLGETRRLYRAVADSPAEKQSVVLRTPEVIQNPIDV